MVLLFFALDLRTLSPPLLSQVKQCLLELANLYALSSSSLNLKSRNFDSSLEDRIGLCYLQHSAAASSNELKVVYSPRGRNFNLRDFHYAVNHLPSDSYMPPFLEDSGSFLLQDVEISCVFNDEMMYSAGGKEIEKKIVLISSCLVGIMDSNAKRTLLDAADKCISVEFLFLEQKSSQLSDISENISKFRGEICDLENCSFNAYLPDGQLFNGLAKRWLKELKENSEELFAHFVFQRSISGSVSRICCRLCNSVNQTMERFSPGEVVMPYVSMNSNPIGFFPKEASSSDKGFLNRCMSLYMLHNIGFVTLLASVLAKELFRFLYCFHMEEKSRMEILHDFMDPFVTHRCHGIQRDEGGDHMFKDCHLSHVKRPEEPINTDSSSTCACENGLLPEVPWQCWKIPSSIMFYVMERTSLASLSEGVVVGRSYFVTPSVVQDTDTASEESDLCPLNNRLFQGLCRALNSTNQGLICWSYCNLEIMRETAFVYYYILQPSDSGLMLLRRLAGAEELLPFPDADTTHTSSDSTTEETDCCIQQCLCDVELRDYNPVLHCAGFHQKLNQYLVDCLSPGPVVPDISVKSFNAFALDDASVSSQSCTVKNDAAPQVNVDVVSLVRDTAADAKQASLSDQADEHDKGIAHLTEEWEQLIVGDIPRMESVLSEPNLEKARTSPLPGHRPLDTRTSKILERLGNPKQIKTKANAPMIMSSFTKNPSESTVNPPIEINAVDQGLTTTSNLMKPTFQRLKRKLR